MKKSKGAKAIAELATQKGNSAEEIRREIQLTIDLSMANQAPKCASMLEEYDKKWR